MIDGTGHSADTFEIPATRGKTMIKTISAALLAVSLAAAPAFATTKTAPVIKAPAVKASVLNANARMGEHHHHHVRHHFHHRKVAAKQTHAKVGFRHAAPTFTKRG